MEIRNSKINGEKGVFATKNYLKGETVHVLAGESYNAPTKESIHIGNNVHVNDEYGMYINHSFSPNVYVKQIELVALCDIKINDEILFNYNDSEINMANPFYDNDILVCGKKTYNLVPF